MPKTIPLNQTLIWLENIQDAPTEILLAELESHYKPSEVPPCPVCGGPLHRVPVEEGSPLEWRCLPYTCKPSTGRRYVKDGRLEDDDHYVRSLWVDTVPGDPLVKVIEKTTMEE